MGILTMSTVLVSPVAGVMLWRALRDDLKFNMSERPQEPSVVLCARDTAETPAFLLVERLCKCFRTLKLLLVRVVANRPFVCQTPKTASSHGFDASCTHKPADDGHAQPGTTVDIEALSQSLTQFGLPLLSSPPLSR